MAGLYRQSGSTIRIGNLICSGNSTEPGGRAHSTAEKRAGALESAQVFGAGALTQAVQGDRSHRCHERHELRRAGLALGGTAERTAHRGRHPQCRAAHVGLCCLGFRSGWGGGECVAASCPVAADTTALHAERCAVSDRFNGPERVVGLAAGRWQGWKRYS